MRSAVSLRLLSLTLALLLAAASTTSSCAPSRRSPDDPRLPPSTRTRDTDSASSIPDAARWQSLAARPGYATTARTESVKLILDLEDDGRLYFLDSSRWDLHYAFVRAYLDRTADHATFNVRQYRRPDRRFLLGTLVHYLDGDHVTLELVAGDTMDDERIALLFDHVARNVYFGDRLRFRPTSPAQELSAARLGSRIRAISSDTVQADLRYQPLVVGEAYGYLRFHRGELDLASLRPDEIVVTDDVPEEIAPISALVTSRLQAPLAHVAVLCRNRGTPDMALRGAIDDPALRALEGRLVRLRVTPQEFSVEEATVAQAEPSWAARRPRERFVPALDTRSAELEEVRDLGLDDVDRAGAKASQLGELCTVGDDVVTPGGFVVPVHHDLAHRARSRIAATLARLLSPAVVNGTPEDRARLLAEIRDAILRAPVDPSLLASVRARVHARPGSRFILRSSTNAEDLVGFNGAGLYESVVVTADASESVLADAMRRVWASVWLTRAHEERSWYRIDHARVAMALLVQPFVDDLIANGVAITANPFFERRPGVFINVQTQEGSVTGARGDELPEQYLVYTWTDEDEPELLSRSSLTNGAPILLPDDLHRLTSALERIHAHFVPTYGGAANAVDVEFLFTQQRRFVFVQARPYRVDYAPDQTRSPDPMPTGFVDGPMR